jgi:hypothetical protein
VGCRLVALDEKALVFGIEDGAGDVISGELPHRLLRVPQRQQLADFNEWLRAAYGRSLLVIADPEDRGRGRALTWSWLDGREELRSLLRSRNGLRRWSQMQTCGTVEKSRRRRLGEGSDR